MKTIKMTPTVSSFFISFIAAFLMSSGQCFAANFETEIDRLLDLPENKIDIGIVALTVAKEFYPNLDIKAYSAKIDEMVRKVKLLTKGSTDPDYRIRVLNTYLYRKVGIKYDLTDLKTEKPENRYLNGIIDTKKGSCVTMPLLYLAIAQRLGYPVYPVTLPQHLILRYVDLSLKMQNIEATNGGGYSPDEEYIEVLNISKTGIENGTYLKSLSYHEFVVELISELGNSLANRGMYQKAIFCLERAVLHRPTSATYNFALGRAYRLQGRHVDTVLSNLYMRKGDHFYQQAYELGYVLLNNEGYVEEQKKAQEKFRKKQKDG